MEENRIGEKVHFPVQKHSQDNAGVALGQVCGTYLERPEERHSPTTLTKFKEFCRYGGRERSRCDKLEISNSRRFKATIAVQGKKSMKCVSLVIMLCNYAFFGIFFVD